MHFIMTPEQNLRGRNSLLSCPLNICIQEALGVKDVSVGHSIIGINGRTFKYNNPVMFNFIIANDGGSCPDPIEFDLDIPSELIYD